jgi:hypothetical protein
MVQAVDFIQHPSDEEFRLLGCPCLSCKNRRFRGAYHLHYQCDKTRRARNNVNCKSQPKHTVQIDLCMSDGVILP